MAQPQRTFEQPPAAIAAVGRVGDVLAPPVRAVAKPADHSSQALAAAGLLLLVAAGLSVLRLGRLMSRELLWGRPG